MSILINSWYAPPVGHLVEALYYAHGHFVADPRNRASLILNAATATEVAALCDFVEKVFPVSYEFEPIPSDGDPDFTQIPREWDWVLHDRRSVDRAQLSHFRGLKLFHNAVKRHLKARRGTSLLGDRTSSLVDYVPNQRLRIPLPSEARARARSVIPGGGKAIVVMPTGSAPAWNYPSTASWSRILRALSVTYPGVTIVLLGKSTIDGRTTSTIAADSLERLRSLGPLVDAFNLDLLTQLAIVELADVFLSPHTGFGLAALAVGTPWATISGGRWPEFFYNGVPFRSVLPDPRAYPCYPGVDGYLPLFLDDEDDEGPRAASMSQQRIAEDLDRIVIAVDDLLDGHLSYETAMHEHFANLTRFYRGDTARIWSIDDVHIDYLQ